MMIFFWILIIAVIFYWFRDHETTKTTFHNDHSPEDMLKERYVNGEINEETFERMKKTIRY
ncbi:MULTISPECIES: SHOCT domain-containing protein [Clostridia]|jgi:uncharacterized membrane protein|uniref:SHOCT domain-containing protein n=1 Tax=Petrocella atlantisensis TaxID=2173034 RepID=A0A3P7PT31_9FIRM|nr:SHOCT domain-containing protein [Petrocella atlantisensis]PKM65486.1 MAG: hypothetical protein CVU95_15265 [Firmicutes bacterium HGW-Firmicutes-2]VDN47197.1 conserved protein of unknown function [Petrocella atlantisensis]